ncbi:SLATT domain-containing protein [Actinokineospora guangxiensis]|uniref:SLATT domain-containing protein n=1 Tax=Actinokineospora guangxiensis TaxID=1490288 RepID=A0ABW0ENP2_9PSEU
MPRNLSHPPISRSAPDTTHRERLESLFRWAEERTQRTIDWYLWRKTSRSRLSKACRAAAILLGVAGAALPLVHSAYPPGPAPEWGFVLLALSGGCVLADRLFGFSSSWTRFMRTQAALQAELAVAQARFLGWSGAQGDTEAVTPESAADLIAITQELIEKTSAVVLQETATWADDLTVQIDQADARFTSPGGPLAP